jgi:hypothetical protein
MGREPFLTTLARNTIAAGLLAIVFLFALPRHGNLLWDYVDVFTLAFCFTFLGHYVDALLLRVREIELGAGRIIRVLGWFAGGLWCYIVGRWLWNLYGRDPHDLPRLVWGGVFFVVLELIAHAGLKARGRPSFYDHG